MSYGLCITNQECCVRSRFQGQGQVIPSHNICGDGIICLCSWNLTTPLKYHGGNWTVVTSLYLFLTHWPYQMVGHKLERILINMIWIIHGSSAGMLGMWPSDTIWWHRSGSTLAQVMACCLTAPSHYLNQCWLIISKVQWHSSEHNCTRDTSALNH